MLARYSSVDPDTGVYSKPAHAQLAYGTMVFIRAGIVREAATVLARAVTVAVRVGGFWLVWVGGKGVDVFLGVGVVVLCG